MVQSVAECSRVLQCVAVCCSVLQSVAVCCSVMHSAAIPLVIVVVSDDYVLRCVARPRIEKSHSSLPRTGRFPTF